METKQGPRREAGFVTHDSGERIDFVTGSRRDTETGKPRIDLIDHDFMTSVSSRMDGLGEQGVDDLWLALTNLTYFVTSPDRFPEHVERVAARVLIYTYGTNPTPAVDGIHTDALIRYGGLLSRGAEKYGADNWRKGQNMSRTYSSLLRHFVQWIDGRDDGEDHFAAVLFNLNALWLVASNRGRFPADLYDLKSPFQRDREAYDAT